MKSFISFSLFCFLTGNVYSLETKQNCDAEIPRPKLIATADGKSFYADRSAFRSWAAAGKYCDSLDMSLASITSKEQEAALKAAFHSYDFTSDYWTSGREAHLGHQFSWNKTSEAVSPDLTFMNAVLPYQTCVMYRSLPNNGSGLYYWTCDIEIYMGTLCEI